jgi:hypothetical protein
MSSDRARVSYDPKQQYRSVVMQQGRVTLEADWNEAAQISSEELRRETLDFVGPCGTPDDGYEILLASSPANAPYDFTIQPGTMYVGGVRAHLLAAVDYANQPDWQDIGPEDPYWVSLHSLPGSPFAANEFVYLYLREQEVSAVEDQDLKDVALGGPDTAQRTRLLQRFVRLPCDGTTCAAGLIAAEAQWAQQGLTFEPHTMRLKSSSTLLVGFVAAQQSQTPCQPQAQGGYVDPDNQLIRVQIAGVDPSSANPQLIWGFDDASFLYRVQLNPANNTLVFQSTPVDAEHQPISGQIVELLRTAAVLPNGQYVAAATGFVMKLDQNYDPDRESIAIPGGVTLPADYLGDNQSPPTHAGQLFLRVWKGMVAGVPGTAQTLGDTGVQVTLGSQSPSHPIHVGDYWMFAVRPITPTIVYPERYQKTPQPPEGSRLWACPLGVISWNDAVGTLSSDCRNRFCNLVDACRRQQGCCTITVRPQDVLGKVSLQSILQQASSPTMQVSAVTPGANGNNIAIEISNLDLSVTPPTFDLTVAQSDIYLGLTPGGESNGLASVLNTVAGNALAFVPGSVNTDLLPLDQQVRFSGGSEAASAQAQVMDSTNQQVLCTLQARAPGADGNLTQVTISNVLPTSPQVFDLTLTWKKRVSGVNMATLFPTIQNSFGYEIKAQPPITVAPAFPAERVTQLSGGADVDPATGTNPVAAQAYVFGNSVKICLRPGSYALAHPLAFGVEQSNITLEACNSATIAVTTSEGNRNPAEFAFGMIYLTEARNVTFRGLDFAMPRVRALDFPLGGVGAGALGDPTLVNIDLSFGLTVLGVTGLTVENCNFRFPAAQLDEVLLAAGIFAGADCSEVNLTGNAFLGPAAVKTVKSFASTTPALVIASGYVQADRVQFDTGDKGTTGAGLLIPSRVDNLVVAKNNFANLTFPVAVTTALGAARFEGNLMRSCLTGFTILPLVATFATANALAVNDTRAQALNNSTAQRMFSLVATYPLPKSYVPKRKISLVSTISPVESTRVGARFPVSKIVEVALRPAAVAPAPAPTADLVRPSPAAMPKLRLAPLPAKIAQFMTNVSSRDVITELFKNLDFSVQFSHNDVDALVSGADGGWALSILDFANLLDLFTDVRSNESVFGTLNLTGNKFQSSSVSNSTVNTVMAMTYYCAATGNIILNRSGGGSLSIGVFAGGLEVARNVAHAAVTGNILKGPTSLPPREGSTSLPAWDTYNDLI